MIKKFLSVAAMILGLYTLNRFWWIPHSSGLLHRVLSCWFADWLAGGMMTILLFAALHLSCRKPPRPLPCLALALLCGLFWEYITPLYLPRSVHDPLDIAAVLLGCGCILPILYRFER